MKTDIIRQTTLRVGATVIGLLVMALTVQGGGTMVTNNTVADTCIRESGADANYGTKLWLTVEDSDSTLRSWSFFKWDLSGIDTNAYIVDATFQVYQSNWGPVGYTVDVYAVDSGDWSEMSVTWNSWNSMTTSLDHLGSFIVKHFTVGPCTFTSPELTEWTQNWIDGDQENYGLLLKSSTTNIPQIVFYPREVTNQVDPQLLLDIGEFPKGTLIVIQ